MEQSRPRSVLFEIARDEKTQLYLFPDEPNTLTQLQQLQAGQIKHLRFS